MNPCTEEKASTLIQDPFWGCQEKLDGRRILIRSNGDVVEGINRKGFIVTVAPAIVEAVSRLGVTVILDGEGIGDRLYTFGLLEMDGNDMRGLPYIEMYRELEHLLEGRPTSALPLVELATTASEKRNLLHRLRAENREGIVFKHLASAYAPNKPASGGSHLKLKFYATCSVIVTAINDKRSVQVAVVPLNASNGETIPVGNVTIPVNKDIPDVGAVAEVRYLYAFKGGSLCQPQYLGTRDDILPKECSEAQLKFKSTMDIDG
jgi:bifunctional non-homologous end joining protein LigD